MSEPKKTNPEVQPKPTRRTFTAEYKRRIVAEADQCEHGDLGALLRREGLYYSQIADWRRGVDDGMLGSKKRGPGGTEVRAPSIAVAETCFLRSTRACCVSDHARFLEPDGFESVVFSVADGHRARPRPIE